nr:phospholipid carrier-dependent glycosyltransferase [Geobacter grbiciae]
MWNHPELRNIIVYWSMKLLGSGVWGIKGWSFLFGTLTVPLMALVGRRIFRNGTIALIAALFWALDPLAIDFSRQAINDIYLAFFPLAAILCAYRFTDSRNPLWLIVAGVLFGFGLASKWSALFQIIPTGMLLVHVLRSGRANRASFAGKMLFLFASLVILPVTIYLITFFPWFGRGYSVAEWPALQKAMYRETKLHTGYQKTIVGDHKAYEWFILPVTYQDIFFNKQEEGEARHVPTFEENAVILLVVTNPLVWLLVLPAVGRAAYRGIRERDEGLCYLSALFLLSYLPLAAVHRPIWVNTALAVLPYALMAVAWFVWDILRNISARRRIVAVYLAVVVVLAVPQYVLVIGKGFSIPYVREYLMEKYSHDENPQR